MKHGTFYSQDLKATVKQINKRVARKLYDSGKSFYIQSCNMHFDNIWQKPYIINKDMVQYEGLTFEQVINDYTCYNCDAVRGRYPNFFIYSN